jgi:hypothetical protein
MLKTLIITSCAVLLFAACGPREKTQSNAPANPATSSNSPTVPPQQPKADPSQPDATASTSERKPSQDLPRPGTVNDHSSPTAEPRDPKAQTPEK